MNKETILSNFEDVSNDNWSLIDVVSLKSKKGNLSFDVYYLDGHPMFERFLTGTDINFIKFSRKLGVYGTSEKMNTSNRKVDKFYIRTNISNEKQELKLIEHFIENINLSNEQKNVIDHLRNMNVVTEDNKDYRALYFCGYSKHIDSIDFDSVRFYFRCFGVNESLDNDIAYLNYCEQCPLIRNDPTFQVLKRIIFNKRAKFRSIGIEISSAKELKIKYYISDFEETKDLKRVLYDLKMFEQYRDDVGRLIGVIADISSFKCSFIQLSSGYNDEGKCINMYFEKEQTEKKIYYSMRNGLVIRNIGGVYFLIDIHEKHYYDFKNLFSVNEIGKAIIDYIMENGICTIEAIVSNLQTLIKDYHSEMYSLIYSDCKNFVNELLNLGYLEEVN